MSGIGTDNGGSFFRVHGYRLETDSVAGTEQQLDPGHDFLVSPDEPEPFIPLQFFQIDLGDGICHMEKRGPFGDRVFDRERGIVIG